MMGKGSNIGISGELLSLQNLEANKFLDGAVKFLDSKKPKKVALKPKKKIVSLKDRINKVIMDTAHQDKRFMRIDIDDKLAQRGILVTEETVRNYLRRLIGQGVLEYLGNGIYELVENED